MENDKEENHKSGGFFGNITKRIGKRHTNKYSIRSEGDKNCVVLHGSILSIPCRNVLALAKWIGLDMQLKEVDAMVKKEHKTEAFLKMNPAGTMPTLDDDGYFIWESRAILTYLLTKYGKEHLNLYPQDVQKRGLIDNMLFFDASSLYPSLGEYFFPQVFFGAPANSEKEAKMRDKLSVLNTILSKQGYVAGNQISIADLSVLGGLSLLEVCEYSVASYPHIEQWIDKVKKEIPHYEQVTQGGVDAVTNFFKSHNK